MTDNSIDKLAQDVQVLLGVNLTPGQLAALELYEQELSKWNAVHSLTAIHSPDEIRIKHFLDSFSAYLVLRDSKMDQVIDVGTGAGFPGIPLKILCPRIRLVLVDSIGKKTAFCRHIVNTLGLENVEVIQERAENIGRKIDHREKYDWAIARAVAVMPVLVEYLLPLVRVGGQILAMKGESGPRESHAAEDVFHLLGGRLRQLVGVTLPGVVEERFLVAVEKVAATPSNFPRRVGIPAKRPL